MTAQIPVTSISRPPLPTTPKELPSEEEFHELNPSTKAQVQIQVDGKIVSEHPLDQPSFTIGRYSKSDIQIASPRVSRRHALLYQNDGVWIIEDADSLNGLTWRGYRISQMALSNGDRIYLDPGIVLQYIEEG
jgi:pSer/pThr/pTyr-binding forkhead associated (FHA) protein